MNNKNKKVYYCNEKGCGQLFTSHYLFCGHIIKQHREQCQIYDDNKINKRVLTKPVFFKCLYESCNKLYIKKSLLLRHNKFHYGKRDFVCNKEGCLKAFFNKSTLIIHQRVHTGQKPYICSFLKCRRSFNQYSNLFKHQLSHSDKRFYKCLLCGRSYKQSSGLAEHKKLIHNKCNGPKQKDLKKISSAKLVIKQNFFCNYVNCQQIFKTSYLFQQHLKTHLQEFPFKCDVCNCVYETIIELKKHIEIHKDNELLSLIHQKLSTRRNQNVNVIDFAGIDNESNLIGSTLSNNNFEIDLIDKEESAFVKNKNNPSSYISENNVLTYEEFQSNVNRIENEIFSCSHECCEKTFESVKSLQNHSEFNHRLLKFKCGICGKESKTFADMKKHLRVHTGEKPYFCGYENCNMSFSTSSILKNHQRKHTGERPFVCDSNGCNKVFSTLTNFQNHQRIHGGVKPFLCTYLNCGKGFTEYSSLFKHKVTHTLDKPYKCKLCDNSYRQSSSLAQHRRKCHQDQI